MAYGAVTRNLVKRVEELEADLAVLRPAFRSLMRLHEEREAGRITTRNYLIEIDAALGHYFSTKAGQDDLQNYDGR